MFCCPKMKLCMDSSTASTAGPNCAKCDGPNEGNNLPIVDADCGGICENSESCCNSGLYCDPFTKVCLDKTNDAVTGPFCG